MYAIKQGSPLSLQCYLAFILILLSHTMISVENPTSSPSHWGSPCSAMCPLVLIPGHAPAGQICAPWGTKGVELVPQSLCSFLPKCLKKWNRKLFLPSREGCVWTSIAAYCRMQVQPPSFQSHYRNLVLLT